MGAVPESLFVLALRDQALAPDFSEGLQVVWNRNRRPRPGRLVLVRDKFGRDHARQLREHPAPGNWYAAAINSPTYVSFDLQADGLTILAVHQGLLEAEDDA